LDDWQYYSCLLFNPGNDVFQYIIPLDFYRPVLCVGNDQLRAIRPAVGHDRRGGFSQQDPAPARELLL
jgi:hypothetical protein